MIDIYLVLGLLLLHFVADFMLQNGWMALGKSKRWTPLLAHTIAYSLYFWAVLLNWRFALVTFVAHTATDYCTSRWSSYLWGRGERREFFIVIGLDQWLHAVQLLVTAKWVGLL